MEQKAGPFSTARRAFLATYALAACAAALSLTAHHAMAATSSNLQQDATQAYEWSIDLDCTLCHGAQTASVSMQSDSPADSTATAEVDVDANVLTSENAEPTALGTKSAADTAMSASDIHQTKAEDKGPSTIDRYAAQHVENLGFTCISCHEDTEGLAAGHKKLNSGKEATHLRKSKVDSDLCATCHSVEALASATADSAAVTDGKGTSVNPHDLPKTDSHLGIGCTDCHVAHNVEAHVAETALATCTSCHHANVFACGTCH